MCWTVGVAPWGACELWLARGLGQVTTRGRVAALPPGLGAGRPGRQRAGAGVWPQQGHRGARVGSPRRGRLRPAAPGPGRAPPVRSSRLGPPGPVGEANPQRAAPCSRGGARRTRQPSLRPGRPGVPGPTTAPATPRSWLSLTGRFPRTQAPATHPELTNQAAPARLSRGRSPARPFTYPDNPRKGNGNTPESPQQQTPTTGHTDRETPPSGKPQPPIKSRRHTQQPTPPPHKPPTHTNKQATRACRHRLGRCSARRVSPTGSSRRPCPPRSGSSPQPGSHRTAVAKQQTPPLHVPPREPEDRSIKTIDDIEREPNRVAESSQTPGDDRAATRSRAHSSQTAQAAPPEADRGPAPQTS